MYHNSLYFFLFRLFTSSLTVSYTKRKIFLTSPSGNTSFTVNSFLDVNRSHHHKIRLHCRKSFLCHTGLVLFFLFFVSILYLTLYRPLNMYIPKYPRKFLKLKRRLTLPLTISNNSILHCTLLDSKVLIFNGSNFHHYGQSSDNTIRYTLCHHRTKVIPSDRRVKVYPIHRTTIHGTTRPLPLYICPFTHSLVRNHFVEYESTQPHHSYVLKRYPLNQ